MALEKIAQAIADSPATLDNYLKLASLLGPSNTITIPFDPPDPDNPFNSQKLLLEAINRCNPNDNQLARIYLQLAFLLDNLTDTVPVSGDESLNKKELLTKSIQKDRSQYLPYLVLKSTLEDGENILIEGLREPEDSDYVEKGDSFNASDLIVEAISLKPYESLGYAGLNFLLDDGSTQKLKDNRLMYKGDLVLEASHYAAAYLNPILLTYIKTSYGDFSVSPPTIVFNGQARTAEDLMVWIVDKIGNYPNNYEYQPNYSMALTYLAMLYDPDNDPDFPVDMTDIQLNTPLDVIERAVLIQSNAHNSNAQPMALSYLILALLLSILEPAPRYYQYDNTADIVSFSGITEDTIIEYNGQQYEVEAINDDGETINVSLEPSGTITISEENDQTIVRFDSDIVNNPGTAMLIINPEPVSQEILSLAAIALEPNNLWAQLALGIATNPSQSQTIGGQVFTEQTLLKKVLTEDPVNIMGLLLLGLTLDRNETTLLNSQVMDRQTLFMQAIDQAPSDPVPYLFLSYTLIADDNVITLLDGRVLTRKALEDIANDLSG